MEKPARLKPKEPFYKEVKKEIKDFEIIQLKKTLRSPE